MDDNLKEVNVGLAISQRIKDMRITKADFASRINILPQHVNSILLKESLLTDRLFEISKALDYNFFQLFFDRKPQIWANQSNFTIGDFSDNNVCDPNLIALLKDKDKVISDLNIKLKDLEKKSHENANEKVKLEATVSSLESSIASMEKTISTLNNTIAILANAMAAGGNAAGAQNEFTSPSLSSSIGDLSQE